MTKTSTLNRRDLLLGATPAATAMILGTTAADGTIAEAATPAANYVPAFFNPAEWRFINAAVGRLIPSDGPGPGGTDTGVPEFIDRQMELPYGHGAYFYLQGPFQPDAPVTLGYQLRYTPRELYRTAIAAANDACEAVTGKVFADLTSDEQDRFLRSLEKNEFHRPCRDCRHKADRQSSPRVCYPTIARRTSRTADRKGQNMRVGTNVAIQTLLSNVLHPLLAAGLIWLFAVSPLTAREAILLSALPAGFLGVLFGQRFGVSSVVVGTTLIASTILSAATLAAAIYLTAGIGQ